MTVIQLIHLSRSVTFPIVGRYRGQVGGSLLTDDARLSMPPTPSWYQGREAIRTFLTTSMFAGVGHLKGYRLIPTHANGQPALAIYRRTSADGAYRAYAFKC